ncbi:hypothetical protein [Solicola sp. PLA-1-18]|uniref:hypothetical protein n=1 Tax=Solicola sp. PLA-1-18 TaxID=3380532 RepID=UPI003B76F7D7
MTFNVGALPVAVLAIVTDIPLLIFRERITRWADKSTGRTRSDAKVTSYSRGAWLGAFVFFAGAAWVLLWDGFA